MTDELTNTVELGRRFVDALVAHDWDSVAGCFAPDARFLAVIANETSPFRENSAGRPRRSRLPAGSAMRTSPS
jgi:hypothetical protein